MNSFSNKPNIRGTKSEVYGKINKNNFNSKNASNVRNENMSPLNDDVEGFMNMGKVHMEEQASVISNNESPYKYINKDHTYNRRNPTNPISQASIYSNLSSRIGSTVNNREMKQFVNPQSARSYSQSLNASQLKNDKQLNMFQTGNNINNDLNNDDKYSCSGYISLNKKRTENLSVAGSTDSFRTQANSQIVEQSIELLKHFISQDKSDYNSDYNEKSNMLLKLIDKVKIYDERVDIFNKEWKHSINSYKKKIDLLNLKFMKLKNENVTLNNENILLKNQIKSIKINYQNDNINAGSTINAKQMQPPGSLEEEQSMQTGKNEISSLANKTLGGNINPPISSSVHTFPKASASKKVVINSMEQVKHTHLNDSFSNSYDETRTDKNHKWDNIDAEYISSIKKQIKEELEEKYKKQLQLLRSNTTSSEITNTPGDFHWDAIQNTLEDLLNDVIKQYNDKVVHMFSEALKESQSSEHIKQKEKQQGETQEGEEVEEEEEEKEKEEKETQTDEASLSISEINKKMLECERLFDHFIQKKIEKKGRSSNRENTCLQLHQTLDTIHTEIENLSDQICNMNININQNDLFNNEEDSPKMLQNMDRSFSESVFEFDEDKQEENETDEVKSNQSMENMFGIDEKDMHISNVNSNCLHIIHQFYANMKEEFQTAAENGIQETYACDRGSNTFPSRINSYKNDMDKHSIHIMNEMDTERKHNEMYNENENVYTYDTMLKTGRDPFSRPLTQPNYANLMHNGQVEEDPLTNGFNKKYDNLQEHINKIHMDPFSEEILNEENKWANENIKSNNECEIENVQSENMTSNRKKKYSNSNNIINNRTEKKPLKDNFFGERKMWRKNENDNETESLKREAINFFDIMRASQNDMPEYGKEQNTKDDKNYHIEDPFTNNSYIYNDTDHNSQQHLTQGAFAYAYATSDNYQNDIEENDVIVNDKNSNSMFDMKFDHQDHTKTENINDISLPEIYITDSYTKEYDLTKGGAVSQFTKQGKTANESEKENQDRNKKSQNDIVNNVSYSYHPLIKKKSLGAAAESDYNKKVVNENAEAITSTTIVAKNPNATIKDRHTLKKRKEINFYEKQEKNNSLEKLQKQWQSKEEEFLTHPDFQENTHSYMNHPLQMETQINENPVFGRSSYDPFKTNTNEIGYEVQDINTNSNQLKNEMEYTARAGNERSNTVDIASYEKIHSSTGLHSNYTNMMNLDDYMKKQTYQKKEPLRKISDASNEREKRTELMQTESGQEKSENIYMEGQHHSNYNYYYPYDEKKKRDEPIIGSFHTSGSILQMENPSNGIISHSYHNKNINLRRINSNALLGNNKNNTADIYQNGRIKLGTKSEIHSSLLNANKGKTKKNLEDLF